MVAIWNDALENYPCQFAVRPTFTKTETVFVDVHQVADSLPVTYATVQAMLVGPVEHIKLTIVVGGTNSDH